MPYKINNGGSMQPYIEKGNGSHSGEYTSISGKEYIASRTNYKKYDKIDFLLFPHISEKEKETERIINILEEGNIANIKDILDNMYIFSKFQYLGHNYDLNSCKTIYDLLFFLEKFYEKYPLESLKKGISLINNLKNDKINNEEYHYYLGARMIKGNHSLNNDCKHSNPNYEKNESYQKNCINCVLAMELRIRGYDVEAKPYNYTIEDGNLNKLYKVFNNDILFKNVTNDSLNKINKIFNELKNINGNSRYIFSYMRYNNIGHVLELVISEGNHTLYDPQSGLEINISSLDLKEIKFFKYDRIDNVGINVKEAKKYVKERK